MFNPVNVLPLHLACQFLISDNYSLVNVDINKTFPKLATELPSGYIVLPEFGAAYKYVDLMVRWNVARQYCIGEGGNLVVVDTLEKYKYVLNMKKSGPHMHAGFHKLFDNTEWTDLRTGLPALKIPWRSDSLHADTRKCAALIGDGSGVVAIGCDEAYTFVCEISLFKG